MSQSSESERGSKSERVLHAYHDGALSGRAQRRFARALGRDPALGRELRLLREVGELAREIDAEAETPDLWDQIALRLPAEEVRREEVRREETRRAEARAGRESAWRALLHGASWLRLVPLGAVAAAALTALLLVRFWATPEVGLAKGGVVRWLDSGGRSIMVVEDDGQTGATLIWLLDPATEGAAWGGSHEAV